MPNRQHKNNDHQPASDKSDDQIINDLIENRKRQMEALIKIMSSIEEGEKESDQAPKPKGNTISRKKK
jgi:hypothetical protein